MLIANGAPKEELKDCLEKVSVAFPYFQTTHLDYCQNLELKLESVAEALQSYNEQLREKLYTVNRLHEAMKRAPEREVVPEVEPEDSVSRVVSRRSSRSSLSSIPSSASSSTMKRIRAKQAVARLKMKQLRRRQELIKQEDEMKRSREMLEAQNEVEQADLADLQIFAEDECEGNSNLLIPTSKLTPETSEWLPRGKEKLHQIDRVGPAQGMENKAMTTPGSTYTDGAEEQTFIVPLPDTIHKYKSSPTPRLDVSCTDLQQLTMTIRQGFVLLKPELTKSDGKPLHYWSFIRSFENTIERNTFDENKKLTYLLQYFTGEANKVIRSCVTLDPSHGHKAARKLLNDRFSHPYKIAMSYVRNVTSGGVIKASDNAGLLAFADELKECENTLEAIGYFDEINSSVNLRRVVERLAYHLKAKWLEKAQDLLEAGKRPKLSHVSEFVMARARSANNPIFSGILTDESKLNRDPVRHRKPERGANLSIEGDVDQNQARNCNDDVIAYLYL